MLRVCLCVCIMSDSLLCCYSLVIIISLFDLLAQERTEKQHNPFLMRMTAIRAHIWSSCSRFYEVKSVEHTKTLMLLLPLPRLLLLLRRWHTVLFCLAQCVNLPVNITIARRKWSETDDQQRKNSQPLTVLCVYEVQTDLKLMLDAGRSLSQEPLAIVFCYYSMIVIRNFHNLSIFLFFFLFSLL